MSTRHRCHWCSEGIHQRHARIADVQLVDNRWHTVACDCDCTDLTLF